MLIYLLSYFSKIHNKFIGALDDINSETDSFIYLFSPNKRLIQSEFLIGLIIIYLSLPIGTLYFPLINNILGFASPKPLYVGNRSANVSICTTLL